MPRSAGSGGEAVRQAVGRRTNMGAQTRGRSVRFFTNTCTTCANNVGVPLLSDFAYGEMIFQTDNGKDFAYAEVIAEDAWSIIAGICENEFGLGRKKPSPKLQVFHCVAIRCADPLDGRPYTTHFPLCPRCGAKLTSYGDNQIHHDGHVPRATWQRFMSLSPEARKSLVRKLWNEEVDP